VRGEAPPPPKSAGVLLGTASLLALGIVLLAAVHRPTVSLNRVQPLPALVEGEPMPLADPGAAPESVAMPEARSFLDAPASGALAYAAGDYEAALAQYLAAIARNPDDAEAHSNAGQVLVRLKRVDEALPYFDRAIVLIPERWAYHFNRARALGLLGRWDDAVEGYRRAQQLFPDDYATAFNLGQALHRAGDHAGAVDQYLRAIELDPADPTFRLALALSYERLQKKPEAAQAYTEYLELAPDGPDAETVKARIASLTGAS